MSVCGPTGKIVIAGDESGAHIITRDFKTLFVYKGTVERQSSIDNPFCCMDAVFDTEGHVLVSDCYNKEVHVVDAGTGKHLKTITSDIFGSIFSLCIHKDG